MVTGRWVSELLQSGPPECGCLTISCPHDPPPPSCSKGLISHQWIWLASGNLCPSHTCPITLAHVPTQVGDHKNWDPWVSAPKSPI